MCKKFFETRTLNYNLRNFRAIQTYRKNTIAFAIETVTYKSSQLWQILQTELKSIESLHECKRKVKEWNGMEKTALADYAKYIYQKFRMNINVHIDTGSIPIFAKHISNFSCFSKSFKHLSFPFLKKEEM